MDNKSIRRVIKESLINFFGNIRLYPGGIILFGNSTYTLKGSDWRDILNIVKPGDIIGVAHNHYLSSFFIKGRFGHVGLYVGNDKVIHERTVGMLEDDILTFLRADNAFVVRPTNRSLVHRAIENAHEQLARHIEYDYDFNKQDATQFYCSEFTDFCYNYILRDGVSKDKSFIYPDDYLIPSKHFEIVWCKK